MNNFNINYANCLTSYTNMAAFRVGRGTLLNVLNSRLISPVLANKSSPCRRIHTAWLLNAGNTEKYH
jgi:hypothetical protein